MENEWANDTDREPGRRSSTMTHLAWQVRAYRNSGGETGEPPAGEESGAGQSVEPAGTTHSLRWPVTAAMRSKSAS
jgi:hypothetical protein